MKITLSTKTILDVTIGVALIGGLVWLTSLHEARAAAEHLVSRLDADAGAAIKARALDAGSAGVLRQGLPPQPQHPQCAHRNHGQAEQLPHDQNKV